MPRGAGMVEGDWVSPAGGALSLCWLVWQTDGVGGGWQRPGMERPGRQYGWSGFLVWPVSGTAGWSVAHALGLGSGRAGVSVGAGRVGS